MARGVQIECKRTETLCQLVLISGWQHNAGLNATLARTAGGNNDKQEVVLTQAQLACCCNCRVAAVFQGCCRAPFHEYLQRVAVRQLEGRGHKPVGHPQDLALLIACGRAVDGAAAWRYDPLYIRIITIGIITLLHHGHECEQESRTVLVADASCTSWCAVPPAWCTASWCRCIQPGAYSLLALRSLPRKLAKCCFASKDCAETTTS